MSPERVTPVGQVGDGVGDAPVPLSLMAMGSLTVLRGCKQWEGLGGLSEDDGVNAGILGEVRRGPGRRHGQTEKAEQDDEGGAHAPFHAQPSSRRAESGERRAESGERRAESGERRAESGERRAESGERRAESGERRAFLNLLSCCQGGWPLVVSLGTAVPGRIPTATRPENSSPALHKNGPLYLVI